MKFSSKQQRVTESLGANESSEWYLVRTSRSLMKWRSKVMNGLYVTCNLRPDSQSEPWDSQAGGMVITMERWSPIWFDPGFALGRKSCPYHTRATESHPHTEYKLRHTSPIADKLPNSWKPHHSSSHYTNTTSCAQFATHTQHVVFLILNFGDLGLKKVWGVGFGGMAEPHQQQWAAPLLRVRQSVHVAH
jgi:hypothetical protein